MASVTKIREGCWRLRYRSPDGGSRTESFKRECDAEARRTEVEHSKLKGAYVETSAGRMSLDVFVTEHYRATTVHLVGVLT